jgi:hypothetical protein
VSATARHVAAALCGATTLALAPHAFADDADRAHTHAGFYASVGLGAGFAGASVHTSATAGTLRVGGSAPTTDANGRLSSFTVPFHLLLGGAPLPGLIVGGGHFGNLSPSASSKIDGALSGTLSTFTFGITGPFVDWYPRPRGGFHTIAMLGLADAIEAAAPAGSTSATTRGLLGFGGALGVGYTLWVGRGFDVGLLARAQFGEATFSGATSPANADVVGDDLHEQQLLFNGALLLTAAYH